MAAGEDSGGEEKLEGKARQGLARGSETGKKKRCLAGEEMGLAGGGGVW